MDIGTENNGGVLTIRIDRPAKKNAITSAMYAAMADALHAAETDGAVRVVLIHGAPDVFCAGNDIEDFVAAPPNAEGVPDSLPEQHKSRTRQVGPGQGQGGAATGRATGGRQRRDRGRGRGTGRLTRRTR